MEAGISCRRPDGVKGAMPPPIDGAGAQMSTELRKSPRKTIRTVAYLYTADGWPLGECEMRDVSAGGARLSHAIADELPDELFLTLSRDGKVRRRCGIVRREDGQIGVRFQKSD